MATPLEKMLADPAYVKNLREIDRSTGIDTEGSLNEIRLEDSRGLTDAYKASAALKMVQSRVPSSFAINNFLGGDSGTGPVPGRLSSTKGFTDAIRNTIQNPDWAADPHQFAKAYSFNSGVADVDFDRYYEHPQYGKLGWSPYRDNEKLYNQKGSWYDDFKRMASQWPGLAGLGAKSLYTGWFNPTAEPDREMAAGMERRMGIAASSRPGLGGKAINFMSNSAYTVGIIGQIAAEEAVLLMATAFTRGMSSGATFPMMMARGAKGVSNILMGGQMMNKIVKGLTGTNDLINKTLRTPKDARDLWNSVRGIGHFLNPLKQTTAFARGIATEGSAISRLNDFAKLQRGAGSLYRDLRMINAAAAESRLQGGFTTNELTRDWINDYYNENNKMPEGDAALKIYNKAQTAGQMETLINMPFIYFTNSIVLGRAFKGFQFGNIAASNLSRQTGKTVVKDATKGYVRMADGFKKFTKAAYWKQSPTAIIAGGLRYGKANFFEGFQESMQDVIAVGVKDYYRNIYEDPALAGKRQIWGSFKKGMDAQMTEQGLEVFLGGFLMGGFLQIPQNILFNTLPKAYKATTNRVQFEADKAARNASVDSYLASLNYVHKHGIKYFSMLDENMVKQQHYATYGTMAEGANDYKGVRDALTDANWTHFHNVIRNGGFEHIVTELENLKGLKPEELGEAFNNPHYAGNKDNKPIHQRIDDVIDRAKDIHDRYNEFDARWGNPVDMTAFKRGTPEYKAAEIAHHAWENAKMNAAYGGYAFDDVVKRQHSIISSFMDNMGTSKIAGTDFTSILDKEQHMSRIKELNARIELGGDTADQKKDLKQTIELRDSHNEIRTLLDEYNKKVEEHRSKPINQAEAFDNVPLFDDINEKLQEAYFKHAKLLATHAGEILLDKNLVDSFAKFKDYIELEHDRAGFAGFANWLHDPSNFENYANNIHGEILKEEDRLKDIAARVGINVYYTKLDVNGVLQILHNLGVLVHKDDIPKFFTGDMDVRLMDATASEKELDKNSEKYKIAQMVLAQLKEFLERQKTGDEPIGEKEMITTDTSIIAIRNTEATQDLYQLIVDAFNAWNAKQTPENQVEGDMLAPENQDILQDFMKREPEVKIIIDEYNKLKGRTEAPEDIFSDAARAAAEAAGLLAAEATTRAAMAANNPLKQAGVAFLTKRIEELEKQKELLGIDMDRIDDTLLYLDELLNGTIELSKDDINYILKSIKYIQDQINTLKGIISTTTTAKTKRGIAAAERIETRTEEIVTQKEAVHEEFVLLNDIQNRVRELKDQAQQLEAIHTDMTNQLDYYNKLLIDPLMPVINRENITHRIKRIEGKMNHIQKLIKIIKDIIRKSIGYIRDYIKIWEVNDTRLSKFQKDNNYKNLSTAELKALINSTLESDTATLDDYAELKIQFDALEAIVLSNIDAIEINEEVQAADNERLSDFQSKLSVYGDQVRYLNALLDTGHTDIYVGGKRIGYMMRVTNVEKAGTEYRLRFTYNEQEYAVDVSNKSEAIDYLKLIVPEDSTKKGRIEYKDVMTSEIGDIDTGMAAEIVSGEAFKISPPLTIEEKIAELIKNSDDLELTKDQKFYMHKRDAHLPEEQRKKLIRVTSYTGDEEIDTEEPLVKSAITIGKKVDNLYRDFFAGTLKPLDSYGIADDIKIVEAFIKQLEKVKEAMEARGERVISHPEGKGIKVFSDELGIAGEIDLITVDDNGIFRIYDTKTMRGNNFVDHYKGDKNNKYESTKYGKSKKQKHQEQVSVYRILANNTNAIFVTTLGIMPVQVAYQGGDTKTTELKLLKGVEVIPLDKVKDAVLIPIKKAKKKKDPGAPRTRARKEKTQEEIDQAKKEKKEKAAGPVTPAAGVPKGIVHMPAHDSDVNKGKRGYRRIMVSVSNQKGYGFVYAKDLLIKDSMVAQEFKGVGFAVYKNDAGQYVVIDKATGMGMGIVTKTFEDARTTLTEKVKVMGKVEYLKLTSKFVALNKLPISTDVPPVERKRRLADHILYTGNTNGAATAWAEEGKHLVGRTVVYDVKTLDLPEMTPENKNEVEDAYQTAVKQLNRKPLGGRTHPGRLLRKEYLHVKAADAIFAIGVLVYPGKKGVAGVTNTLSHPIIDGGAAYTVQMAANLGKPIYIFDQNQKKWFSYADNTLSPIAPPTLTKKFAGIGTETLNAAGRQEIKNTYARTMGIGTSTVSAGEAATAAKAQIIYTTPGVDYSNLLDANVVDADDIMFKFMTEHVPPLTDMNDQPITDPKKAGQVLFVKYSAMIKDVMIKIFAAKAAGKTVITSNWFMREHADKAYLSKDTVELAKTFELRGQTAAEAMASATKKVEDETRFFKDKPKVKGENFVTEIPTGVSLKDIVTKKEVGVKEGRARFISDIAATENVENFERELTRLMEVNPRYLEQIGITSPEVTELLNKRRAAISKVPTYEKGKYVVSRITNERGIITEKKKDGTIKVSFPSKRGISIFTKAEIDKFLKPFTAVSVVAPITLSEEDIQVMKDNLAALAAFAADKVARAEAQESERTEQQIIEKMKKDKLTCATKPKI